MRGKGTLRGTLSWALSLFLVTLWSSSGFCWGALGHWTVARLAESGLTAKTAAQIKLVLDNQPLAYFSTTPDDWRYQNKWKFSSSYHFDTIPDGQSYLQTLSSMEKNQMAKGGVVLAILRSVEVLKNAEKTGFSPEARNALIFLIHFVGDIHQPLHVGRPGDAGGNAVPVLWGDKKTNLHAVWDSLLIARAHEKFLDGNEVVESSVRYSQHLATKFKGAKSDQLTEAFSKPFSENRIENWIQEQMDIREALYHGFDQDQDVYAEHFIEIIDYQIYLAGVRLAQILNTIFEGPGMANKSSLQLSIEKIIGRIENVIRLIPLEKGI
jgi:hypothetical protein